MRRNVTLLALLAAVCMGVGVGPAWAAKPRTPVTSSAKNLEISPQELRIRVRALIRPTLGTVEEAADRIIILETSDPVVRRGALVWKIETTTTLLSALLRNDPLLALADAWGYVLQVETLLERADVKAKYGAFTPEAAGALAEVEAQFRSFLASDQVDFGDQSFEATVRQWADRHPIEGALYRRPSMDSAVADLLASSAGGGAFAALGNLDETTSDVMTRMDLYTTYMPRLARWESELAVDDLARGVDPKALVADVDRLTGAVDRLAAVAEAAPELVARERAAALEAVSAERLAATEDLRGERRAVLDAVRQERIATLQEVEAIAQRLVDRSSGPLREAVRADLTESIESVERMRKRLIDDAEVSLNRVVDHAFVRALQLLLIAAALAAAGLVLNARLLRR